MDNNRQNRKRTKSHHHNGRFSNHRTPHHSSVSTSKSSTYVPNNFNTSPIQLQLKTEELNGDSPKSKAAPVSVDDAKVISFLSKLQSKLTLSYSNELTHVTLILSKMESRLLQEDQTLKQSMVEHFKIKDLVFTEGTNEGSIDSLVTIYGTPFAMSKASTFLIYKINSQINNLNQEPFTLKSSNYKIHLLVENASQVYNIKYIDNLSISYGESGLYNIFIQGDLTSIFNFMLHLTERKWNEVKLEDVPLNATFGIHLDSALKNISEQNLKIKSRSESKLLKYLYPSSKLKQLSAET
ncbi:uncharacterized protein KGF55_003643 [Candida pseudojiufengensis]|uniref:uncharacterized protein n=1 Tax=Candida pseudojiufengensis TaxID=497109 RepID=UPI00222548F8|nr:uncharacterized protein KGF55_003643 [Candida pseudojiufengensis]KAI5962567.1 hypothetical protein KGF55_003643 [Candida pseudojiufengensis]